MDSESSSSSSSKVSLKLLIDTKANKVLFAEAGKDVVDFLINLLSLPVATVIRLLSKNTMVGSLGNLYDSVENLSNTYMQPSQNKDSLLNPQLPMSAAQLPLLLTDCDHSVTRKLCMCSNCLLWVAESPRAVCPHCKILMKKEVSLVDLKNASGSEGGYVKGVVTYMVMDDLVVQPMSTISSITMLNKFNVKEVVALEEREVNLGMNEGLKLLRESLQSRTVLTSVFLEKK